MHADSLVSMNFQGAWFSLGFGPWARGKMIITGIINKEITQIELLPRAKLAYTKAFF